MSRFNLYRVKYFGPTSWELETQCIRFRRKKINFYRTNPEHFAFHFRNFFFSHHSSLETVWTAFPMIILLFIAGPSMSLIYTQDEIIAPDLTVKIIGHQWY